MKTVYVENSNGFSEYEITEMTGILGIYEPEEESLYNNDFDNFNDFEI